MTNNTHTSIKALYALLKPVQQEMLNNYLNTSGRKYCIHSSRRLGKTFFLVVLACIVALNKPNAQIRYASVTQKAVRKMVHPIFKDVIKAINSQNRPQWNSLEGAYIFPNGSQIHVLGVNNGHSDDARGTAAHLAIIDEAGFVDELRYLIDSVLMPQLLTTNGRLVMASSSPLTPAHDFVSYIQECRDAKHYSSFTIHEGGYSKETVQEFCKEAGGESSTTWRREYLNEIIVDSKYAIISEFSKILIQEYKPTDLDKYYHRYVSMDIGTRDFTAILFGIYDFKKATLFILEEIIIDGPDVTTRNIASLIEAKEKELAFTNPYKRIADNNNLILLQDLGSEFNLHFTPTNKDKLEAMVNELRLWVQNKRIIISPKCTQTIGCLEFGVWNKDRKDWAKSKQYGHFDALAALMYLVRNVDQNTNPIPISHGATIFTHYIPEREEDPAINILKILNQG